jgi:hypothetical protein
MKPILIFCTAFLLVSTGANAQTPAKSRSARAGTQAPENTRMIQSVNAFLKTLSEAQRKKATYPFEDEERFNWHFVPIERNGLPIREMNEDQRKAAMAVLRIGLSEQGFTKARAIMDLEVILKELENLPPENDRRHPEKYYFTVFGTPSAQEPWGWRVEGHHLSLNFSSVSGEIASQTPAFMGTNPAIVPSGPQKGKQILKQEAEMGFALVNSFSADQLKKVVIADVAPNDIVTGNSRKAMLEHPEGIHFTEMTPDQQKMLRQLLELYIRNYEKDIAAGLLQKVEAAGMDQLHFAWAGSRDPGVPGAYKAHYYRIHGPVILIEYDNSQNDANHVHTVVRDLTNDFAEDALQKHYQFHKHGN